MDYEILGSPWKPTRWTRQTNSFVLTPDEDGRLHEAGWSTVRGGDVGPSLNVVRRLKTFEDVIRRLIFKKF